MARQLKHLRKYPRRISGVRRPGKYRAGSKKKNVPDFVKNKILTEQQINLLKRRLNDGKIKHSDIFGESGEKVFRLTPEQTRKGLKWLMNKWKTPRGVERKNNPFGYREQNVLENFSHFELADFHNNVNYWQSQSGINNYVPVWDVIGKGNIGFQYYMEGGEPKIIG